MASPYQPVVFGDQASGGTGTVQNATNLNTFIVSGTALLSGTTPGTSASLVLTYGAQSFVVQNNTAGVDNGGGASFYTLAAGTLTVTASKDTYIEVSAAGVITQNAVANNAAAPTQTSNTIRLWKVVSGASTISAVTLLANTGAVIPLLTTPGAISLTGPGPAQTIQTAGTANDLYLASGRNVAIQALNNGHVYTYGGTGGTTLLVDASTLGVTIAAGATGGLTVSAGGAAITGAVTVTTIKSGIYRTPSFANTIDQLGTGVTITGGFGGRGAGQVTFSTSSTPSGQLCRISVPDSFLGAGLVMLSPALGVGAARFFANSLDATHFAIFADNAPPNGSYALNWFLTDLV